MALSDRLEQFVTAPNGALLDRWDNACRQGAWTKGPPPAQQSGVGQTTSDVTTTHYTALHCTALHCTALHCTALHCTALHYPTPHHTMLHHTTL